jgi:hypothetical protein
MDVLRFFSSLTIKSFEIVHSVAADHKKWAGQSQQYAVANLVPHALKLHMERTAAAATAT